MRRLDFLVTACAAISCVLAGSARAGGLLVGETGSQAMERGGAFVARADDPSALWINPAGLAKVHGRAEFYIGSSVVDYSLTYQRSGTYQPRGFDEPAYTGQPYPEMTNGSPVQPVPGLAAAGKWRNLGFAGGLYGPQAYPGRDFACDVERNCLVGPAQGPAPQRYDIVHQEALIALPSLGFAYRVHPRLDVGVRLSWGFAHLKARSFVWGLRNDAQDVDKDGDFSVDASDGFVPAFGAGVLARPTDNIEIGAAYSSRIEVQAKGTGIAVLGAGLGVGGVHDTIQPVPQGMGICAPDEQGTASELKACVNTGVAQTAAVGARYIMRDPAGAERGDVELDVKWENWSNESDIEVIVDGQSELLGRYLQTSLIKHGYKDVIAARLGGSWSFPVGANALQVRGGIAYDTAAAPVSWTRLDMDGTDRFTAAAGAAYQFGKYRVDAGFAAVIEPSRDVERPTVDPIAANQRPIDRREHPDALQPLLDPQSQLEAPFNEGHYESHYLIGMVGLTGWF